MSGLPLPLTLPRSRKARDEAERAIRARFESALSAGRVGTWRWHVRSGSVDWDAALEALFGLETGSFEGTYDGYTRRVHAEDLPVVEAALDRALHSLDSDEYGIEHRIVLPDGGLRWVEVIGRVIRDASGETTEMAGIVLDADDRRRLEDERAAAVTAAFGAQRALDAAQRRLRLLDRATEALDAPDAGQAVQQMADLVVDELADWCLIDLAHGQEMSRAAVAYRDTVVEELVHVLHDLPSSQAFSPGCAEPVFVADLTRTDIDTAVSDPAHRAVLHSLRQPGSYLLLPLVCEDQTLGAITMVTGNGWQLDSEDMRLARELAHRTAAKLAQAHTGPVAAEVRRTAQHEAERMAAVHRYDILETPPDGAFDRITALAARLFNVPIAIVSIVDTDRIWFKSHHGIDVDQIDRDPGLCASAILQEGPWVVSNAPMDPRTLANPLVAGELGLKFYAGVPLTTYDGYNLGTLCIIDQEPREMSPADLATLADLAGLVMDELEIRRVARSAAGPAAAAEAESA
jgi:PAS domain S-box-containing protein